MMTQEPQNKTHLHPSMRKTLGYNTANLESHNPRMMKNLGGKAFLYNPRMRKELGDTQGQRQGPGNPMMTWNLGKTRKRTYQDLKTGHNRSPT